MAKAKKRVAVRKKNSKRGKASAKPARKRAAKRATCSARGHEHEISSQEKAAAGDNGNETSRRGAGNHG